MAEIIYIDPMYIHYRKLWKTDRWKFSAEIVRLTIKQGKGTLDEIEIRKMDTMERVIEENDGQWLDGYGWDEKAVINQLKQTNSKKKNR